MKPLRIAVNTRLLVPNKLEGIGRFTLEILRRMVVSHPEVNFIFYFDRPVPEEFILNENVTGKHLFPPARRTFLFDFWFNWSVSRQLKKDQVDLFFSPDGFVSLRTEIKQLAVIHDLNFEHFPKLLPSKIARYYQARFPKFAKKASRLVTVSEYSKKDIQACYNIAPETIDVVYNGVDDRFYPREKEEIQIIREEYADACPYFIYVGSINPRKNIPRLLQAFEAFRSLGGKAKLVLIGAAMWDGSEEQNVLNTMSFSNEVIQLGRMKHEEMSRCLAGALAMTFVPLFEGFGIPAIESFASGVPLVCSDNSSLPEVVGDAALLVNAEDVDGIAKGMLQLEADENLRADLISKGLKRARMFSWENAAEKLWESILKTLDDA
jgi:glycosyltransferase involved in cell wall biosynthesis